MDIDQGVQAAEKAEPAGNHAWYLIYTKPNAEYQVDHHLAEQGLDTYLPTVRSARPRRGHTTEPLFPGYLFVRADWTSTPLSLVRWTPGVRRVVSFGGRPAVVPDRVIAYIRQRIAALNAGGGFGPGHLRPGDAVRIVEGPLAGLEAVFDGIERQHRPENLLPGRIERRCGTRPTVCFCQRSDGLDARQPATHGLSPCLASRSQHRADRQCHEGAFGLCPLRAKPG